MTKMKKKIVALLRVSSDQQDFNSQKQGIEDYCIKNKIFIHEWIEEHDVSGYSTKLEDRDGLQRIKNMSLNGEIDTLVIFNIDRLGRDTSLLQYLIGLNQLGVKVKSVMDGDVDALDLNNQLISYIKFYVAETESRKISQRIKSGVKAKNLQGLAPACIPCYGYDKLNVDEYIINENEAITVKMIYEIALERGISYIRKYLNHTLKIPSKVSKQWSMSGLYYLLTNPIYRGVRRYNGFQLVNENDKTNKRRRFYKDKAEYQEYNENLRIVSDELWFSVQDALKNRRTSEKGSRLMANYRTDALLEGLLFHKCCYDGSTHKMVVDRFKSSSGNTTQMYVCKYCKMKPKGIKIKQSIVGHKIHIAFEDALKENIMNLDLELLKQEMLDKLYKGNKNVIQEIKLLQEILSKKKKALEKAEKDLEKIYLGEMDLPLTTISNLINKLESSIIETEQKINSLSGENVQKDFNEKQIKKLINKYKTFQEVYFNPSTSLQDKKRLLIKVVDEVKWNGENDSLEIEFLKLF